jgi:DNA-binding NtrC family response regulator
VPSAIAYAFDRQRIVVAEEDSVTTAMIVATLRRDGHCVAHDPGALSAPYSALTQCHLLIGSLKAEAMGRMELLEDLREHLPGLPILYVTDDVDSPATPESPLPEGLALLRVPFTTGELRAAVGRLLFHG